MSKSVLAKTPSGEIQLTVDITKEEIATAYKNVMSSVVEETELPGFRKGKAPKAMVEDKADKSKVYEKVLESVIPEAYFAAVKEHKVAPIISPKVELISAKEGEDWQFKATTCEEPVVNLGDYKAAIKKAIGTPKIWVPGEDKDKKEDPDEKVQKAIKALIETIKIDLPEILLEDEVNRALSNLINQTNSLGVTVEQYLSSIGKTSDQVRAEYKQKVTEDVTLQLALNKIALEEKLEVTEKEIDDFINTLGDEKTKQTFTDPMQRNYLKGIILRRKALDFTTTL